MLRGEEPVTVYGSRITEKTGSNSVVSGKSGLLQVRLPRLIEDAETIGGLNGSTQHSAQNYIH
jgi:hypothetical protein